MRRPREYVCLSTCLDSGRYDDDVAFAASTDHHTIILQDPSCAISIESTAQVKGITFYAIDLTSAKGQWRVFRRYRQFLKLQVRLHTTGSCCRLPHAVPESNAACIFGRPVQWTRVSS